MTFTTSNYSKMGTAANSYAISRSVPSWYNGKQLPILAPTWEMVQGYKKGALTEHQYGELYFQLLIDRQIDFNALLGSIRPDACFLCYEAPFEFCHRRLLSMAIESQTGITVPELFDAPMLERVQLLTSTLEF